MDYQFLQKRGALDEGAVEARAGLAVRVAPFGDIPANVVELLPESVARENIVLPLAFDGETLTVAAVNAGDIALTDRLRFLVAKNVRLTAAPRQAIVEAINRLYGRTETESVDSMLQEFNDSDLDHEACQTPPTVTAAGASHQWASRPSAGRYLGKGLVEFKKDKKALGDQHEQLAFAEHRRPRSMFFYIVPEGQRALMSRKDGSMEVIVGPKRIWRGSNRFEPMTAYMAHPGEFLILRFRNGEQQHLAGPVEVWFDPRVHQQITRENCLQIAAKEAVVVYSKPDGGQAITRRIVFGPALFVPRPGEWLHTFSWHASRGGSRGAQKVANALVFQKLWMMPDQMYHDVSDVRTADDAVLTIRLMIFFELVDVERMLDATHDPIGDFVNAATSDVVSFTVRFSFEDFKRNTSQLNELEAYKQLTGRAEQCGYRINKVVYRGYGAADALQQMHDQAIQARTRLQLDRATEQQAQDLENYKLECQLGRAGKRRTEQISEVEHDLGLSRTKQEEEIRQSETRQASHREARRLEAELNQQIRRQQDAAQREHLDALRGLGVDLTAYLTQARADQVIELRGGTQPHLHLDKPIKDGKK